MTHTWHPGVLLVSISLALASCSDSRSSLAPAAPSPISQPPPIPQPAPQPPSALQPTVIAVTPNITSTAGNAWGTITGDRFQRGATVMLGAAAAAYVFVRDDHTILFGTTSHSAGTVDLVVTNPGGLNSTLTAGYTFAPPESFDAAGDWVAHAGPEYETDMRFTIRNNVLVNLTCGSGDPVTLSPPPSVQNGEFSYLGADGIAVSGHLVSPVNAAGAINVPGCNAALWWADKSGATQHAGAR